MTPVYLVLRIEYRSSRCQGAWEICTFSLSHMNRLNKIRSAILILYFGFVALEGSTFHQNFYFLSLPSRFKWFTFELYHKCNHQRKNDPTLAGARGRARCCSFHYLPWTDSIKYRKKELLKKQDPKSGFAIFILYFGSVDLEGSTFHHNFYIPNSGC